jgi:hypothetical protein
LVLLGYLGEPVFRLDRAGLWVNAASPTAVVVGVLSKAQRLVAPTPRWRLQRGRSSVAWHDARAQGLPPGVDHGAWSVPLIVDGGRSRLEGELQRFPDPSLPAWFAICACLLAAGASPLLLRHRDLVRSAAIGFAVAAAAASVVFAFAFDSYASPGTWIEALDEIAFLAVGSAFYSEDPRTCTSVPRSGSDWSAWRSASSTAPSSCTRSCSPPCPPWSHGSSSWPRSAAA